MVPIAVFAAAGTAGRSCCRQTRVRRVLDPRSGAQCACMETRVARVIVVGGGISGLCVAYFLRKAGLEVQVLETRRVGSGASWGNAGWVTPAQAGPLPEPGLLGYGLRSLLDRERARYFQPGPLI